MRIGRLQNLIEKIRRESNSETQIMILIIINIIVIKKNDRNFEG